jgi:hypothetical protein
LDAISLEDFALSPAETARSKEFEEFPQVMEYLSYHDLENVVRRTASRKF